MRVDVRERWGERESERESELEREREMEGGEKGSVQLTNVCGRMRRFIAVGKNSPV